FEAYARGFLDGCGGGLPSSEVMLMPEGALMMTLECGMRFLTDYLSGDTYFRIAYPEHNLVRARTQIALAREMWEQFADMKRIIEKIDQES
ncbi:MAG: aminoglycoside phosphotransferase, partial [Alistipes sp.]|nr:aminoglycoside phosphotransferase [Alistipes sp.]